MKFDKHLLFLSRLMKISWLINVKVTHTYTHSRFMALWILSGTTRVSRYQKKHSPTHPSWSSNIPICFLHLLRSMAFSLFNPVLKLMNYNVVIISMHTAL